MGRRVYTNGVDSWRLFSSITDSDVVEFKTEAGLMRFIAVEKIYEAKLKAIETLMCFPTGWFVNDVRQPVGTEAQEAYFEWYTSMSKQSDTYEAYYATIDAKLTELLALNPDED